jgi:endonuclease G
MMSKNKRILFGGIVLLALIIVVIRTLSKQNTSIAEMKFDDKHIMVEHALVKNEPQNRLITSDSPMDSAHARTILRYELPDCNNKLVIHHIGYSLEYDELNEQAKWVAYQLTSTETVRKYKRTNRFLSDPFISTGTAKDIDYRKSGYDRGHLATAADMGWSAQSMTESFFYSNISPQEPGFNRGIWKRLEEQVRDWAVELDTIYVVTGPVLSGKLEMMGPNKVAVPNFYYKAVLYLHGKHSRAIGFIMANRATQNDVFEYAVSVDSIEKVTGLDLFASLEDKFEKTLENTTYTSCWNRSKSQSKKQEQTQSNENQSVQCSGITRAGRRCKRMTRNSNERCYQHQ